MTRVQWTQAGPKVRYRIVPDPEPYDVSFIDTWDDLSAEQKEAEKQLLYKRVEEEGAYGYEIQELKDVLCPHCKGVTHQVWELTDSCWGFIGYESAAVEVKQVWGILT